MFLWLTSCFLTIAHFDVCFIKPTHQCILVGKREIKDIETLNIQTQYSIYSMYNNSHAAFLNVIAMVMNCRKSMAIHETNIKSQRKLM